MLRKFVRTAMAFAAMASIVATSTAATASVRPGQSVVSAERAAASTSVMPQRAGAAMQNSNQATSTAWIILILAIFPIGFGIRAALRDNKPTSP